MCREFAAAEIAPHADRWWREERCPTEAEAGSDADDIKTHARKEGDEWVSNGAKVFISNAGTEMSQGPVVLSLLPSEDGERRYGNFYVPREAPGYEIGPKMHGIAWHAIDTRELSFTDVRVPADHLVGEPGRGLAQF